MLSSAPSQSRPWWARVGPGIALVLLARLAYQPAISNGWIWDDDDHVTDNEFLPEPYGLAFIWMQPGATPQYYPLVFTSFWVEYQLWGDDARPYHLANVLLHGLNACLVWRVLRRIGVRWAWVAAAVFAVHPVHVESVAWVTERKNVLSGLFYLSAFLAYLRFDETGRRRWYALATALFVAALLSKTVTCTLPAVLLLVAWWKHGRIGRRDLLRLGPWLVIGVASGLFTAWVEKTYVGAAGADWSLTPTQRCLIAGNALAFYAGKLAAPWPLMFIYHRWHIDPADPLWYVAPIAVLLVIAGLWLARRRLGRGPLVAVLAFAGTLFPALGFFDVYPFRYSFVADHFQYLASIPLIALAAAAAGTLLGNRRVGPILVAAVLIALGVLTAKRTVVYENEQTLWEETLERYPDCSLAHARLGVFFATRHDYGPATDHFAEVVRLHPESIGDRRRHAYLAEAAGRPAEAAAEFREVLARDPADLEARLHLAQTLVALGRDAEAATEFEAALKQVPFDAHLHFYLGMARSRLGERDVAIAELTRARRIAPKNDRFAKALEELKNPVPEPRRGGRK